jgi:RND family efflux transporter MFP subunit
MSANRSRLGPKIVLVFLLLAAAGVIAVFLTRPVAKVAEVSRGTAANVVSGSVVIDAARVSQITSEAAGRLIESELAPGRQVKEGEKLAQIDTTDVDLEIEHAQAELKAAKRNADIAKTVADLNWETKEEDLKEAERAFKENRLSGVEFERQQRAHEIAKQERDRAAAANADTIERLEHDLKLAERKKEKMTIVAPLAGTITEVFVNRNDLVSEKQALGAMIALTRTVRAKISEENFALVQVGQKARVSLLGYPDQAFDATVTQKLPAAEPGTQRYSVYLQMDEKQIPPEKLVANMTGDVAISIDQRENVTIVPRRAVFDGNVYVVAGGRVQQRPVDLGYMDLTTAEVKKGLAPGEQVIVEELEKFSAGDRVRIEVVK